MCIRDRDNVILGMAVLDGKFLVGKVVEVNYSTSRVLLLSDLNSKIPVSIEPNSVQSILSGSGSSYGEIQYIKENYELENDSEIFTSGSGGIFRSGIPIGKTIANEEIGLDTIKVKFSILYQLLYYLSQFLMNLILTILTLNISLLIFHLY